MNAAGTERAEGFFEIFRALIRGGWLGKLSHRQLRVLLALMLHIDADGAAWPSTVTLATLAGLQLRAAKRALQELEEMGLIRTDADDQRGGRRPGGRYRCATRRIVIPTVVNSTTDNGVNSVKGGRFAQGRVVDSRTKGGRGAQFKGGQNDHQNSPLNCALNSPQQLLSPENGNSVVVVVERVLKECGFGFSEDEAKQLSQLNSPIEFVKDAIDAVNVRNDRAQLKSRKGLLAKFLTDKTFDRDELEKHRDQLKQAEADRQRAEAAETQQRKIKAIKQAEFETLFEVCKRVKTTDASDAELRRMVRRFREDPNTGKAALIDRVFKELTATVAA